MRKTSYETGELMNMAVILILPLAFVKSASIARTIISIDVQNANGSLILDCSIILLADKYLSKVVTSAHESIRTNGLTIDDFVVNCS